jgi:hypothetical protein
MTKYTGFKTILAFWLLIVFVLTGCIAQRKKPIIYIYPTQETEVTIKLDFDGKLTHTYPYYNEEKGWKVKASPDGTLIDSETGKEYYALFWEGDGANFSTPETGFVIKGSQTVAFLEEKLEILGLNRREANEFIVYWLPEMENNAYNFVHFAQESYTESAGLNISPTPETLIRVFMLFKPLKSVKEVNLQELESVKRTGFTVVEWGGSQIETVQVNSK